MQSGERLRSLGPVFDQFKLLIRRMFANSIQMSHCDCGSVYSYHVFQILIILEYKLPLWKLPHMYCTSFTVCGFRRVMKFINTAAARRSCNGCTSGRELCVCVCVCVYVYM